MTPDGLLMVSFIRYVLSLAFAPAMHQGTGLPMIYPPILASGGGDRIVSIWNVQTGELKSSLQVIASHLLDVLP
jgi:WD40 repeat protein